MTPDNWINLVTAIGTLAAVVAAVRIATGTQRRSEDEAKTRAKLAAAGIVARLTTTLDLLSSLRARSAFAAGDDAGRTKMLVEARRLLTSGYYQPDGSTLLALTPLAANCAHRIASAFDYMDRVRLKIDALPKGLIIEITTAERREQLFEEWAEDIGVAYELLTVALRECVVARDLGAPPPTGAELHGNEL